MCFFVKRSYLHRFSHLLLLFASCILVFFCYYLHYLPVYIMHTRTHSDILQNNFAWSCNESAASQCLLQSLVYSSICLLCCVYVSVSSLFQQPEFTHHVPLFAFTLVLRLFFTECTRWWNREHKFSLAFKNENLCVYVFNIYRNSMI